MPLVSTGNQTGGDEGEEGEEAILTLRNIIRDALLSGDDINDDPNDPSSPEATLEQPPMSTQTSLDSSSSCLEPDAEPDYDDAYADVQMKLLTADIMNGGEVHQLEPHEMRLVYTEIHGRQPPEVEMMEDRLNELDRELWKLPREEKDALLRVLRKNPLLFIVSSHTKLFLCAEDFDARRAAQRLASYWKRREQLFGEENAFMEGDVPAAQLDDYNRFYARSERVVDDPNADDVEKAISRDFIRCVNRAKVEFMEKSVWDALENRKDILFWLEECELVRDVGKPSRKIAGTEEEKMLFVRCENFVEATAAGRLMKYWSKKCDLFGPYLAAKDITLDHMKEDCWDVLNLGFLRIMPGADMYGRVVTVFSMKILTDALDELDEEGERSIMKTIWYVLSAALEQKNCQRNGLVFLANLRGGSTDLLRRFKLRAACREILMRCIPVQIKAFHFFFPPSQSWWQSMIYTVFRHAEPLYKKHAVIHAGASQERELSELAGCGLLPSELPTELGGDVQFDLYKEWLAERKASGL